MGVEAGEFVHPERISSELLCPICACVLENPVQTPSEHLFCEDELLEWMIQSDVCPVTKNKLNPDDIKKPGRIIANMLGELERYCPNRVDGCEWQGKNYSCPAHFKTCPYKPREQMSQEMAAKDASIEKLRARNERLQSTVDSLERRNHDLSSQVDMLSKKLKVYDAFLREADGLQNGDTQAGETAEGTAMSDLERITRLRRLDQEIHKIGVGVDSDCTGHTSTTSCSTAAATRAKQEKGVPHTGNVASAKQAWSSGSHSRPSPDPPKADAKNDYSRW